METGGIKVRPISVEALERQRFVQAGLEYVGTPYHHMGMVKGAGVDCATLLACAAKDAGLGTVTVPYYAPYWNLFRSEELYLDIIKQVCVEVAFPALAGDIVVWKFGRTFSHGAIVVDWPKIVHAQMGCPVVVESVDNAIWLTRDGNKPRPVKLFSHWPRGKP